MNNDCYNSHILISFQKHLYIR